jgi:hypothetical protein
MLRVARGHAVPSAVALRSHEPLLVPPLPLRPRIAKPSPVVPRPPARTFAVRGRASNGSAAALILEPGAVSIVAADRSGRLRVRRFTIAEVLCVEEHRLARSSDVTIVTASGAISIADVDIAQAWTFCRESRLAIWKGSGPHGARSPHNVAVGDQAP